MGESKSFWTVLGPPLAEDGKSMRDAREVYVWQGLVGATPSATLKIREALLEMLVMLLVVATFFLGLVAGTSPPGAYPPGGLGLLAVVALFGLFIVLFAGIVKTLRMMRAPAPTPVRCRVTGASLWGTVMRLEPVVE